MIRFILNSFLLITLALHYCYAIDIEIVNNEAIKTTKTQYADILHIWKDGPVTVSCGSKKTPITVDFHAQVNPKLREKQGSMRFYQGDKLKTYYYPTETIEEKNLSSHGTTAKNLDTKLESDLKSNQVPETLRTNTIKRIFFKILNNFQNEQLQK